MNAPHAEGWIDVSVAIRDGMTHWPGDPPVKVGLSQSIAGGDPANVTHLNLGAHSGTHVDAPRHFSEDGAGIDSMPLVAGIGPARVVEIFDPEEVGAEELGRHQPRDGERLILKTRNSARSWADEPFDEGFVHLAPEAARLLADRGVRTVGVDYLSVGGRGWRTGQSLPAGRRELSDAGPHDQPKRNVRDAHETRYEKAQKWRRS